VRVVAVVILAKLGRFLVLVKGKQATAGVRYGQRVR